MIKRFASLLAVIFLMACLLTPMGIAAAKGAVSFWVYEPELKREQLEKAVALFERETGYDVEITYIPKSDFNTKLNTAIATGQAPEVSYLDQPLVPRFAVDGILLNLDPYADGKTGIDRSKYYQGALNTNVVGKKLYGLPLNQTCVALYYNRDLIKTPPTTWDEWIDMAKKVYKKGQIAAMEVPPGGGWGAWLFPAFVASAGGRMVSDDETKVAFDEQPAIDALKLWLEMRKYSDKEVQDSANSFQNGLVATKISGPWEISGFRQNFPNLKFGVALVPAKTKDGIHASNIGGENLVIYKSAKNPQAAWELIRFLTYRPENAILCAEVTGNFPVLLEAAQDDRYRKDESLKVFLKQMETAQARPRMTSWLKINDEIVGKALDQALSGELSPEEALKQAAKKANLLIQRDK
ncbi:MAG: ABC transporter substrate-binding protein [Clostridia bacterium]|nr:ABC transporter substrate-binding protein [Clostridia bacterium]